MAKSDRNHERRVRRALKKHDLRLSKSRRTGSYTVFDDNNVKAATSPFLRLENVEMWTKDTM